MQIVITMGFPGGLVVKNPSANGDTVPSLSQKICWRRKWPPTPVLLPGESHGGRSLVGYSSWGHKELDTTERLHFHFHFGLFIFIMAQCHSFVNTMHSTIYGHLDHVIFEDTMKNGAVNICLLALGAYMHFSYLRMKLFITESQDMCISILGDDISFQSRVHVYTFTSKV